MISAKQARVNAEISKASYKNVNEAVEIISEKISEQSNLGKLSCVAEIDKNDMTLTDAQIEEIKNVLKLNDFKVTSSSTSTVYKFAVTWNIEA